MKLILLLRQTTQLRPLRELRLWWREPQNRSSSRGLRFVRACVRFSHRLAGASADEKADGLFDWSDRILIPDSGRTPPYKRLMARCGLLRPSRLRVFSVSRRLRGDVSLQQNEGHAENKLSGQGWQKCRQDYADGESWLRSGMAGVRLPDPPYCCIGSYPGLACRTSAAGSRRLAVPFLRHLSFGSRSLFVTHLQSRPKPVLALSA